MSDTNGHVWRIGRFQADDESECQLCGVQSDMAEADEPCTYASSKLSFSERNKMKALEKMLEGEAPYPVGTVVRYLQDELADLKKRAGL